MIHLPLPLILALAAVQPPALPAEAADRFAYEPVPFDLAATVVQTGDGFTVQDVSYASPKGGRVTAYLVLPAGSGPFAGIAFGHWGYGNRTEFLPEAEMYARAGAASLLVDYPWVRPAPWRRTTARGFAEPEVDRDVFIQAVVDLRRGLDLLASRGDVDPARLAYVGHSYGAQWGAILAALDRRLKTAVLVAGVGALADIFLDSKDPDIAGLREATPRAELARYLEVHSVLDAIRYVPHAAPTPLLFQFARHERYLDLSAMERYAAAASQPKTVLWYDAGHEVNHPRALQDRADWLARHVGLEPVPMLEGTPASGSEEARQEIARAWAEYREVLTRGDAEAFARAYTADAVLMEPNLEDIRGREALAAFAARGFAGMKIVEVENTTWELDLEGDTAHELGTFAETVATPDGTTTRHRGRYAAVWKKEADGRWRIHRLMVHPLPAGD